MANSLFNAMNQNKNSGNNFISQFKAFMEQMKGQNPNELLNNVIQQKGITQQQINELQSKAQQIMPQMEALKNMFGFK